MTSYKDTLRGRILRGTGNIYGACTGLSPAPLREVDKILRDTDDLPGQSTADVAKVRMARIALLQAQVHARDTEIEALMSDREGMRAIQEALECRQPAGGGRSVSVMIAGLLEENRKLLAGDTDQVAWYQYENVRLEAMLTAARTAVRDAVQPLVGLGCGWPAEAARARAEADARRAEVTARQAEATSRLGRHLLEWNTMIAAQRAAATEQALRSSGTR